MSEASLRFVQLRRTSDPDGSCSTGPKVVTEVVDFGDDWSPQVKEAVTAGDREQALALHTARAAERDDLLEDVGRLALALLLRAAIDSRLTVGKLRAVIAERRMAPDPPRGAVADLTRWAVDMIVLGRFLGRPRGAAAALTRLLRGIALLRLASSKAEDACLVRTLIGGRELELPPPPKPVPPPDPDAERVKRLSGLSVEVGRLLTRARAAGKPDPTLADMQSGGFKDLHPAIEATALAAAELGVPPTATLRGLRKVLDTERDVARRRSSTAEAGDFEATVEAETAYIPPSVPVLKAQARIAGRGDLMIIRTTHLRYEPGEISHIENVLASEVRARTHVVDTRTSETITTSTQSISETTRELETTEQNSLDRALQTAATQSTSMSLGVSVSGGFGPIQAGVDINADRSTTTETSMSSAVSYAKTMTESAAELLRTEVSQRRTSISTTRVTETNEHRFDNAGGSANIAGVYRWLNKVDQAQLYNYGERLMLEFIVPEPAAQLVYLAQQDTDQGAVPKPAGWFLEIEELTEENYVAKAARWDVLGVEPPPEEEVFATATFADPAARPFDYPRNTTDKSQPEWGYSSYVGEVGVPNGYAAGDAYVTVTWALESGEYSTEGGQSTQAVQIAIGEKRVTVSDADDGELTVPLDHVLPGPLPIGLSADQRGGLTVVVRVRCERTRAAFEAWRLRTYETIRAGYLAQSSAYENDQRRRQAREAYRSDQPSSVNRRVEQAELKRACQTVLSGQDFDLFGALTFPADDAPRINRMELAKEADYIQFFEDVFDWENMVYLFYPYQWAGRERWGTLRARTSTDPTHEAFLRAGAARVMVPVRAGYEHAVGDYFATSEVPKLSPKRWRGRSNPYPPIEELIGDALDRPGMEIAVDEPWEIVTPTSLIYLQPDAELNPAP
ncbi:hypothetical protein GCM10009555_063820 [Acrocarpospora macrocephala]|uniref:Uncharacterized protein n=1 Tax=Acrocarpospora macrocephala TaxID=150177 RepID=A0A5M3WLA0_9ACTN|nr:hypothetical protein [Acrocarpospora macrocephala]GES07683.1 hypothetical protein Amac_012780 [Acrocarpospora macrocephala]